MPPPCVVRRILFTMVSSGLAAASAAGAQSFVMDSSVCAARANNARGGTDSSGRRTVPDTMRPAAVVLFAAASAREVTFAKEPEIRVRLCGGLDSIRVVERRNLPDPVVVSRTYRDVYVAVEIFGRINADCIVASLTSAAADSAGRRNACASLEIGVSRTRPQN